MTRLWLLVAGIGGMASVIAGAVAAHLADDPTTARLLTNGALYGMVHSAALIAVIALGKAASRGATPPFSPGCSSRLASCCSASRSSRTR